MADNDDKEDVLLRHSVVCKSEPGQPTLPWTCEGCNTFIYDRECRRMAHRNGSFCKIWHTSCVKCYQCGVQFSENETCFWKNEELLCENDYVRMYRSQPRHCARCAQFIAADDLVLWAGVLVYHAHCFSCASCHRILSSGEKFSMDCETGRLHCSKCWRPTGSLGGVLEINRTMDILCESDGRKQSRRRRKNGLPVDSFASLRYGVPNLWISGSQPVVRVPLVACEAFSREYRSDSNNGCPPKAKRQRTSFKHDQLAHMKSFFGRNQNPDAKDLQELASRTGLGKRVLQVWFQNSRAKSRRDACKKSGDGTAKVDRSISKTEKNADSESKTQIFASEASDSTILKLDSERENSLCISGNISEFDSGSPGMESYSEESRSDSAEVRTPLVPWAYDGSYHPEYPNMSTISHSEKGGASCHAYLCDNDLEDHVRRELYSSADISSSGYPGNYSELIPSSKHSFKEMFNSFAR